MSSSFLNLYFYTSSASLKLGTFSRWRRLNFGSCLIIWCHLYDCRGDQRSSVIYKNIILFKKGLSCCFASLSVKFASQTFRRRPLPVCAVFDILFAGATTMFSKKTCGFPSARPIFLEQLRTPLPASAINLERALFNKIFIYNSPQCDVFHVKHRQFFKKYRHLLLKIYKSLLQ